MPLEATVCPCMCTLTGWSRACQRYFMIRTMAVIKDLDTLWCFYVVLFLFLNNNQRGTLVSVFLPQFHKVSVLWFQLYVHVQPQKRGFNRLKKPVMWSTYMCWNATSGVHGYGCAEAGPMKYTDLTSWRQDWMVVNVSVTYLQMA